MLSSADWAQMAVDLTAIRGDNEIAIVIRRGDTALAAQSVRIERSGGRALERDGQGAQQVTGQVVVLGGTGFDVRPGDRFNDGAGVLYEVIFVRPNRRAAVVAEARAVE